MIFVACPTRRHHSKKRHHTAHRTSSFSQQRAYAEDPRIAQDQKVEEDRKAEALRLALYLHAQTLAHTCSPLERALGDTTSWPKYYQTIQEHWYGKVTLL